MQSELNSKIIYLLEKKKMKQNKAGKNTIENTLLSMLKEETHEWIES